MSEPSRLSQSAAFRQPLFAGDPARLRAKLDASGGLLREYWTDFQQRVLADPKTRAAVIALPALLDDQYLPEAKQVVADFHRGLPGTDLNNGTQFHTWCQCGTVLRYAVYFDWLAARGAWSPAEIERAADDFLTFGFKHPFMVLQSRCRSSNNQNLSMALYLAVAGFLFGHKLAQHPTGKFLFDHGLGRIPDLIGLFAGDGYGGEGTTYTSHVNTPLAYWTNELLAALTGRSQLDTPFQPNGTTLRQMLEMERRLASPGGWLAPWDHYGWQRGINASPFAYLARATGDPRHLALIAAHGLWPDPGYLAWGQDDHLWTLLWWPEQFADYNERELPAELFGWCLPRTGAALDDCQHRVRLLQVWDNCAGGITGIGRAQTDPNHVMFDCGGEVVFQDGIQAKEARPWTYPVEKVFARLDPEERARLAAYVGSTGPGYAGLERYLHGIAAGLIGAANAIVLDDEPWYWPGGSRVGRLEWYHRGDDQQAVAADCAAFYQPAYDVTRARRTSIWRPAGFGVIVDDLAADSPHCWQWQVHLRPDTQLAPDASSARIALPNGTHVLLAWEPVAETRLEPLAGFPNTQEQRCARLALRQQGSTARFAVVIAPGAAAASIRRVDDTTVEVVIDGQASRLDLGPPAGSAAPAVKPDTHDVSDIAIDRELQLPELPELLEWTGHWTVPGAPRVTQLDAVLAELGTRLTDLDSLYAALRSPHWPVQAAAAEVLGRKGCRQAAPRLRRLLEAEQARPHEEVYPAEDAAPAGRSTEELAKRWRLKLALIIALGRLRDEAAIPIIGQILAAGRDFYPVHSAAAQALGRIGTPAARAALAPALKDSEHNTVVRARYAVAAMDAAAGTA